MKKIVLLLSVSFLALGVTSCNSDDDSNLQPKTFEAEVNAKSIDKLDASGTLKIQSSTSTMSISRDEDESADTDKEKEKTFPCKGWECIQIAD